MQKKPSAVIRKKISSAFADPRNIMGTVRCATLICPTAVSKLTNLKFFSVNFKRRNSGAEFFRKDQSFGQKRTVFSPNKVLNNRKIVSVNAMISSIWQKFTTPTLVVCCASIYHVFYEFRIISVGVAGREGVYHWTSDSLLWCFSIKCESQIAISKSLHGKYRSFRADHRSKGVFRLLLRTEEYKPSISHCSNKTFAKHE